MDIMYFSYISENVKTNAYLFYTRKRLYFDLSQNLFRISYFSYVVFSINLLCERDASRLAVGARPTRRDAEPS